METMRSQHQGIWILGLFNDRPHHFCFAFCLFHRASWKYFQRSHRKDLFHLPSVLAETIYSSHQQFYMFSCNACGLPQGQKLGLYLVY